MQTSRKHTSHCDEPKGKGHKLSILTQNEEEEGFQQAGLMYRWTVCRWPAQSKLRGLPGWVMELRVFISQGSKRRRDFLLTSSSIQNRSESKCLDIPKSMFSNCFVLELESLPEDSISWIVFLFIWRWGKKVSHQAYRQIQVRSYEAQWLAVSSREGKPLEPPNSMAVVDLSPFVCTSCQGQTGHSWPEERLIRQSISLKRKGTVSSLVYRTWESQNQKG